MKLKQKAQQSKKSTTKPMFHKRSLQQNCKSINTTKEQTHVTFESHHDSTERKLDLRSFKTHRYRKSCLDKLQENQLSPFSSPQAKSLTPVIRKQNYGLDAVQFINEEKKRNGSPKLEKNVEINKKKSKKVITVNNVLKKKKKKGKKKQEQTRIQFENEFIRRMQGRPITELTQQELQVTYKKPIKIKDYSYHQDLYRAMIMKPTQRNFNKKTKGQVIRQMKQKIIEKYQIMYPNLKPNELKILSSVIIIQRLWRQSRVKKFIRDYITIAPTNHGKQVKSILEQGDETYINIKHSQKTRKNQEHLFRQILYSNSKQLNTKKSQTTQNLVEQYQQSPISEQKRKKEFTMMISPRNCKKNILKINLMHRQYDNVASKENESQSENQIQQVQQIYQYESNISDSPEIIWQTPQKRKSSSQHLNLKDLQLSDQLKLSESKQLAFRNFVATYRQLALSTSKKYKKKTRINVFDLPQSLSEKCLMQRFYSKLWQNGKGFNIEQDLDQQLSRSLQKRQQFSSTKIILEKQHNRSIQHDQQLERFYTQNHDQELEKQREYIDALRVDNNVDMQTQKSKPLQSRSLEIQQAQVDLDQNIQTIEPIQKSNSNQLKSLKNINLISQEIVQKLIQEFIDESNPTYKRNQNKKKKRKLPGLAMTFQSIQDYLKGLLDFIKEKEFSSFIQNFYKINPLTVLKINRIPLEGFKVPHSRQIQEDQYQYSGVFQDIFPEPPQTYLQQEQLSCDPTIIPKTTFFQYEQIYEDTQVKIDDQDQKYSTFILSICKINNKCLMDTLIQFLEKWRIEGIKYIWDRQFITKSQKNRNEICQRQNYSPQIKDKEMLFKKLQSVIPLIQRQAFKKLGRLHRRYEETQEKKLLLNLRQQYGDEGKDWLCGIQRLQIRLEIVQQIWRDLIQQFTSELRQFY